ncbi:SDR family NAD(P)-dependent oxidoreductase [Sodalis glossinidius]|uniref:SDR family NAD(P)-dependent oxidoreductase n=1 Tax=Sodalis glossinidius TaxID=63612 RepID=UPI0003228C24
MVKITIAALDAWRVKKALITGGDSGMGRVVAIAYAREGTDVLIAYLNEHDDAKDTARLVQEVGQQVKLAPVYVMLACDEALSVKGKKTE